MDALTAFGLLAVTAMLIFYALEDRSPWFILAFAGACALGSVYGSAGRMAVRRRGGDLGRGRDLAMAGAADRSRIASAASVTAAVSHKGRAKPGK
jgi:hypothetical protein